MTCSNVEYSSSFEKSKNRHQKPLAVGLVCGPTCIVRSAMRCLLVLLLVILAAAGAEDAYSQKHELERDRAGRLLVRGLTMLQMGDAESALQSLEMAHQLAPNEPGILVSIAGAYAELGDYAAALFYSDQGLSLDPTNTDLQLEAASIRIRAGELASAAELLERLAQETAEDVGVATTAARHLADSGFRDQATRILVDQLERHRVDPAVLRTIVETGVSDMADVARSLEAIVSSDDVRSDEINRIAAWIELYGLGNSLHEVVRLIHAQGTVPGFAEPGAVAVAPSVASQRIPDSSISFDVAQLEAAVVADPRDINNWIAAARAYLDAGQPADAWRIAEEGLILFPSNSDLLIDGALSLLEMKRDDEARGLLRTTGLEHPGTTILQSYLKAKSGAAGGTDRYLVEPHDERLGPALISYLSIASALQGDIRKAASAADLALDLAPGHPIALEASGRVRFLQGDAAHAIELLEQAAAIGSDRPRLLETLARFLDETGRTDAAADVRARRTNTP